MDEIEMQKRLDWYERKYGAYIERKGLHNWRNLFRKPNSYEWTILVMMLMVFFIAFSYQSEVRSCKEFIANPSAYGYVPRIIENSNSQFTNKFDSSINITEVLKQNTPKNEVNEE